MTEHQLNILKALTESLGGANVEALNAAIRLIEAIEPTADGVRVRQSDCVWSRCRPCYWTYAFNVTDMSDWYSTQDAADAARKGEDAET